MEQLELICYNCGEKTQNKVALQEILRERNKKILQTFKEEIDELPDDFSFCIKCLSNKKVSLEQEIKHREKVQREIDQDYDTFVKRQKEFEKQEESINEDLEIENLRQAENDLQKIKDKEEIVIKDNQEISKKIKELIDNAQNFEEDHHEMLEKINKLEQEIYSTQQELKKLDNQKEYLDNRVDFLQKFHLLQQIFNFEIQEDCAKLNSVNIGSSSGEVDWTETNTAFDIYYQKIKNQIMKIQNQYIKVQNLIFQIIQNLMKVIKNYYFMDQLLKIIQYFKKDNFNSAIKCLVTCIQQLKNYYEYFFDQKNLEKIWKEDNMLQNSEIKINDLYFEPNKNSVTKWTLNMKVIAINFMILIFCQEKKEEIEFLKYIS